MHNNSYDAKSCKIANSDRRSLLLFKLIEDNPGITTKELVARSKIAQRTVYYYVKQFMEEKFTVYKKQGGLYAKGRPPVVAKEWSHHNILVYFLGKYEVGVLVELCRYINESELFKGRDRTAVPWPKPREWRPIRKSKTIKIACTSDPLTYDELKALREIIWEYFNERKRIRIKCEQNMDTLLGENRVISMDKPMTISELERFIRWYPKAIRGKRVIREERYVEGTVEDIGEMVQKQDDQLYIQKLEEKIQKQQKIIEELQKQLYKCYIDKQRLESRKM